MDRNNNNDLKRKVPEEAEVRGPSTPPALRRGRLSSAAGALSRRRSLGFGATLGAPHSQQAPHRMAACPTIQEGESSASSSSAVDEDELDDVYQHYIQGLAMQLLLKRGAARGRSEAQAQLGLLQRAAGDGAAELEALAGRCEQVLTLRGSQHMVELGKQVVPALLAEGGPGRLAALYQLDTSAKSLANALATKNIKRVEVGSDLDTIADAVSVLKNEVVRAPVLATSIIREIAESGPRLATEFEELEDKRAEAMSQDGGLISCTGDNK